MDSMSTVNSTSSTPSDAALAGLAMVFVLFTFVFIIAVYVFFSICLAKIFKKAGAESWQAWVPFLNNWRMLELGGQQGFWALLAIIPGVNIVSVIFMFIAMYHIDKKLGKEDAFILLAILLPVVWYPWLAFDHSTWDESKGAPRRDTPVVAPTQAAAASATGQTAEHTQVPPTHSA